MSSIFWYQTYEMYGCLNRNHLLGCSMWGQEWPRPAQAFAGRLGRGRTAPRPLWLLCCCSHLHQPPGPETPQMLVPATDLHPCRYASMLKDVTVLFQKKSIFFFQFPCHLFVFSSCSSFKAPCPCSACLCIGYFWKLGNQKEGWNLGELTAVEAESSFPWCALSSLSFLLLTSMVRPPLHRLFQGKL